MNNVTSVTAELLRSGEYSDFTLVCEGQKFPIHKSIVCPQSSVIAAALKSEFQEAKTNTIEVNFESEVLKSMLDYMYTGHYDIKEPTQPVQLLQDAQPSEPAQPDSTDKSEQPGYAASRRYYGVTGLAKLSAAKVQQLLSDCWSANAFCKLVQEVTVLTGDKGLREALAQTANQHILELLRKDIFSEGKVANDIAALVLKASIKSFNSAITQVGSLKAQIQAGNQADKEKINNLEQNLTELADVLSSTRTCCKRECQNPFGLTPGLNPDRSVRRVPKHATHPRQRRTINLSTRTINPLALESDDTYPIREYNERDTIAEQCESLAPRGVEVPLLPHSAYLRGWRSLKSPAPRNWHIPRGFPISPSNAKSEDEAELAGALPSSGSYSGFTSTSQ
ncbi:hypothetical protein CIB48_g8245 [Xylaria polymorpha]|nr:hypothetical protein CIB48_g8245 [Xylaria polymorpha]